jgi:hypothetical protein
MKINISDARRQLCGSACCRWALLKLDLCSITAILHPRLSSHPPLAVKQRERRRDDFIYTRRKPAASPRRRCRGDSAQERNGTERAKGKRRGKETKEKRESRTKGGGAFHRAPMRQGMSRDLFRILYLAGEKDLRSLATLPAACAPGSFPRNDSNLDYFDLRSR